MKNSNDKEKVSIIVPIYNVEMYLEQCVNSIIQQTYSNIEIILVDDGSKDNSAEICKKLERIDSRIKFYKKENGGVSTARNYGIEKSTGSWIMFVDPDDYLDKEIITILLEKSNNDVDIISCCCTVLLADEFYVNNFFNNDFVARNDNDKKKLYLQLMNSSYGQEGKAYTAIGVPWGKLYRRDFLEKNNLRFNPKLKRMQDNIFNMYGFYYASSIVYTNQPLYYYRAEHVMNYLRGSLKKYKSNFQPVIASRYDAMKKLNLYKDKQLFEAYIDEAFNYIHSFICENIEYWIEHEKKMQDVITEIRNYFKEEYFWVIFENNYLEQIRGTKRKICYFLLKKNFLRTLCFVLRVNLIRNKVLSKKGL